MGSALQGDASEPRLPDSVVLPVPPGRRVRNETVGYVRAWGRGAITWDYSQRVKVSRIPSTDEVAAEQADGDDKRRMVSRSGACSLSAVFVLTLRAERNGGKVSLIQLAYGQDS